MSSDAEDYAETGLSTANASGQVHHDRIDGQALVDSVPAILFSAWLRGANEEELLDQLRECLYEDIVCHMEDCEPSKWLSSHKVLRFRTLGMKAAQSGQPSEPWRYTNDISCGFEAYAASFAYRRGHEEQIGRNSELNKIICEFSENSDSVPDES